MLKSKLLTLIVIIFITITTTGCISFKTKGAGGGNDGGIFRSANKGETWQQTTLVPTVSGRPENIGWLDVSSLVMDPSDNKAIYFGSFNNGLFYTYDSARTWQVAIGLGKNTIKSIAVDPNSKCIIYAAIGNTVYKSNDCNRTWSRIYFDNDITVTINTIAIDYYNSRNIYIGSSRGEIIKSSDQGVSWQTLHRFTDSIEKITIDPYDSRNIFSATANKGVYRSNNSGLTWVDLSEKLKEFHAVADFRDLVMPNAEQGLIFLATHYSLLKSIDGGDSWTKIKLITPQQQSTINSIAVNPKNTKEIYYVTNTTFYRSVDGGRNWTPKKLPTTRAGWRLLIDPENPNIIYMGVKKIKR